MSMGSRRVAAVTALVLLLCSLFLLVLTSTRGWPRGLIAAALLVLAARAAWEAIRRRGGPRVMATVVAGLLLVGIGVILLTGRVLDEAILAVILLALTATAARRAFHVRVSVP